MPRARTPNSLLQLGGTFRADRHADRLDAPKFTAVSADVPDELKKRPRAVECWKRLAPRFIEHTLLTVTSRQSLIHICTTHDDIEACNDKIAEEGFWTIYPIFSRKSGEQVGEEERENIAVKTLQKLRLMYNRLLSEFGGTPATASRVESQMKSAPKINPFAQRYGHAQGRS